MSDAGKDDAGSTIALSWLRLEEALPTAEIVALFDIILKGSGYIRNSQKVLAHQPERFFAYTNYGDVVTDPTHSVLDKKEREIVALVVSAFNRCTVFIFSHVAELRRLTGDPVWVEKLTRKAVAKILEDRRHDAVHGAGKIGNPHNAAHAIACLGSNLLSDDPATFPQLLRIVARGCSSTAHCLAVHNHAS